MPIRETKDRDLDRQLDDFSEDISEAKARYLRRRRESSLGGMMERLFQDSEPPPPKPWLTTDPFGTYPIPIRILCWIGLFSIGFVASLMTNLAPRWIFGVWGAPNPNTVYWPEVWISVVNAPVIMGVVLFSLRKLNR